MSKKIEGVAGFLESCIRPLSKFISTISASILFFMMLITVADVFLRKVFSKAILGTFEGTEFMMVILVFFGLARAEFRNAHVKVDLVMNRLSEGAQTWADRLTQLACSLLFAAITVSTMFYSEKIRLSGSISQDLSIPVYPFIYVVALGCAVLSLVLFVKFLKTFTQRGKS